MSEHADGRPLLRLTDSGPLLAGHRCRLCGRVGFPPDPYGCEGCGALVPDLEPIDLAAVGRIQAVAEVHRHHHPEPPTPFTVATIVLDDGPALKAVLDQPGAWAKVGAAVEGLVDSAGALRFGRQAAAATSQGDEPR